MNDFLEKCKNLMLYIQSQVNSVLGLDVKDDSVTGFWEMISFPFNALFYVIDKEPISLFYYFYSGSLTIFVLLGLIYLMWLDVLYRFSRAVLGVLFLAFVVSGHGVTTSLLANGGVVNAVGYFYPTSVLEYGAWFFTFTVGWLNIILTLPFYPFIGWSTPIKEYYNGLKVNMCKPMHFSSRGTLKDARACDVNEVSLMDGF